MANRALNCDDQWAGRRSGDSGLTGAPPSIIFSKDITITSKAPHARCGAGRSVEADRRAGADKGTALLATGVRRDARKRSATNGNCAEGHPAEVPALPRRQVANPALAHPLGQLAKE